jgi:hypothetical protein
MCIACLVWGFYVVAMNFGEVERTGIGFARTLGELADSGESTTSLSHAAAMKGIPVNGNSPYPR